MKLLFSLSLLLFVIGANAQTSVTGKWKTIDDESGEAKSIVEIFERDGAYYGKIIKLFRKPEEDQDPVCTTCPTEDARYKKKIIGMEILKDLKKDEDEYEGGNILDPNNGKIYRCKIWREANTLKIRGYWGPFYRTQTWVAVQ